ncbi:hypothetical protein D7V86_08080 [bacterium D16-51]|nr:hypothetical protein D7V96_09185 [bacterium D16-59]RKI60788.1 hypothetical protein D7V86_08080 [bacterium D16-51]
MNVYESCMGYSLISARHGIREYVLKGCCLWGYRKRAAKPPQKTAPDKKGGSRCGILLSGLRLQR